MDFSKVSAISGSVSIKDLKLVWLEKEAEKDQNYMELHKAVEDGFSEFKSKYGSWMKVAKYQYIRDFRAHWQKLYTNGKLVVMNNRILIPEKCPE